jgi:hypothetical protein
MAKGTRTFAAALVAAAVLLGTTLGAGAHAVRYIQIDVAKSPDGPFKDEIHVSQDAGERRRYTLRVTSPFNSREDVTLRPGYGPANPPSVKVRLFDHKGEEITTEFNSPPEHYVFGLGAHKSRQLTVQVKTTAPDNGCIPVDAVVNNGGSTATIHLNGPCDLP